VKSTTANFFYKPAGAWAADFIPFHKDGRYRLFYLQDWRNPTEYGEGTPWYQISTDDFVHFAEHGMMLRRGGQDEQDLYVFTGSVIEVQGRALEQAGGHYHIFYTGHNPYFREHGKPEQAVMHAVSNDLLNWRKVPADSFYAPDDRFEAHDWRDPFVFWNEEASEYWMLLAARLKAGPSRRRGCTALCVSKDLKTWQVREPFYAPGLYFTHECPDLFRMGDWWYLVFSEFSERCVTRYRMARSLAGPWLTPDDDQFDGRAFYAAKTASDGQRRFVFGWNPTRQGEIDTGAWQWGGNLAIHEVVQDSDGTLGVRVPESVSSAFATPLPVQIHAGVGSHREVETGVILEAPGSFACVRAGEMLDRCKLEATITCTEGTDGCGIMLRVSDDLEQAYYIRFEPRHNRLVFDMWPRAGDIPFMPGLERPLSSVPGKPIAMKVFVDGTVCEVYAEDQSGNQVAMSTRLYNLKSSNWGLFVTEGNADFRNLGAAGD
jgi:beta-fructofuranosidase